MNDNNSCVIGYLFEALRDFSELQFSNGNRITMPHYRAVLSECGSQTLKPEIRVVYEDYSILQFSSQYLSLPNSPNLERRNCSMKELDNIFQKSNNQGNQKVYKVVCL